MAKKAPTETGETAWDKVDRDVLHDPPPPGKPQPVLQDWVCCLGLRLQGVLMGAIRGCDTVHRHDDSKVLARIYRGEILRSHAGDPKKSKSFILAATIPDTIVYMGKYLNDCDHLPAHYVMHFLHASEILGYYHPDPERRDMWQSFYLIACKKYHVRPESRAELLDRLEKDEDTFHKAQDTTVRARLYDENQARIKKAQEEEEQAKRDKAARQRQASRHGEYGGT